MFFLNVNEKLLPDEDCHSRKKQLAVNVSANRSESNIDICGKLVLLICFLADIHLSRWR